MNLLLCLVQDKIQARLCSESITSFHSEADDYHLEKVYFGDWIPLHSQTGKIVGFKIVPFVGNDYLESRVIFSKFVTQAHNLIVEKGEYTYLKIHMSANPSNGEDTMNRIEAALFIAPSGDIAFRLSDLTQREVNLFDFALACESKEKE